MNICLPKSKRTIEVRLKPEFKKAWLKALRSGKYDQTTGVLVEKSDGGDYGFCCLGVACDVLMRQGVELNYSEDGGKCTYGTDEIFPPVAAIPHMFEGVPGQKREFKEWLNLMSPAFDTTVQIKVFSDPEFTLQGEETCSLPGHNDYGRSFLEIADVIEREL